MQVRYRRGWLMVVGMLVAVVGRAGAQEGKWRVQVQFKDKYGGAYSMTAAAAVDTLDCMVMGWSANTNTIWKTSDGGQTWGMVRSDELGESAEDQTHYDAMARPTRNLVLIVGDSGRVLRSTDGGQTWGYGLCDITYGPGPEQRQRLWYLSMVDSLHGIVSSFNKILARTDDGGATWQRMALPSELDGTMAVRSVSCLKAGTYVVLAASVQHCFVYRTDDGGGHWSRSNEVDSLRSLTFLDSLNGWGVGYSPSGFGSTQRAIVCKTTDGGRSWQKVYSQYNEGDFGILSVAFADRDHGMAIGSGAVPIRTSDGGETWKAGPDLQLEFSVLNTRCVTYPHPDKAWVVGVFGHVLVWDNSPAASVEDGAAAGTELAEAGGLAMAPNPLRSIGTVGYSVASRGRVRLVVVDAIGREVARLVDEVLEPGHYNVAIDAAEWSRGAYFLRMESGGRGSARRLIVE